MRNGLGTLLRPEAVFHSRTHALTHSRTYALTHSRTHEHVSRPLGSGFVQLFVVPFSVIVTCAVAEPSYVTTSRRVSATAASFAYCSDASMLRIVVPAVG